MLKLFSPLYPRAEMDWFHFWQLDEPLVWCFIFFWVFSLGACFGSFLNVCIWRIPRGESLCRNSSHCTSCGFPIRWFDNIPVLSYLILRGRCRHCRAPYSPRYLAVELLCGTLFAGALLKIGLVRQPWEVMVNYGIVMLYCVAAAWIDAEHGVIPDKLTLPVFCFALLFAFLLPGARGMDNAFLSVSGALAAGIIPALLPAFFALAGQWSKKDLFGWGDVKFLCVSGMLIGLPGAVFTLLFASFTGMAAGLLYAIVKKKDPAGVSIPLAPFMSAGILGWIFCGQWIMRACFDWTQPILFS